MGCSKSRSAYEEMFNANIFQLSKEYYQVVMYVRNSNLFKEKNQKLEKAVKQYLVNYNKFNQKNMDLKCVDVVHKLHPKDYGTNKVDEQYLIKACLRQQQFCRKLNLRNLIYEDCLEGYVNFLKLIKERPNKITVPSLNEDFIWHSHMQDHENYKRDTIKIVGYVLNHNDQIPVEKLKQFWDQAKQKRQQIHGIKFNEYQIPKEKLESKIRQPQKVH